MSLNLILILFKLSGSNQRWLQMVGDEFKMVKYEDDYHHQGYINKKVKLVKMVKVGKVKKN